MLEKIVGGLGASPIQYRFLLRTENIVAKRALEGKRGFSNQSLVSLTFALCFLMSAPIAILPLIISVDMSTFTYALLGITMSMFMTGLLSLGYFNFLFSPINYPVVAHTPVSSRTYFLVKLTQVLTPTVPILASLNLLPAICGIWIRGGSASELQFFFPIVYLPIAFMSNFFTIGVMTTVAGYLTKLHSKKALRHIAKSAPFVVPILFPSLFYFLPHDITVYKSALKWLYMLPNGWFAGAVPLLLGTTERPELVRDLILTGLAVVSTLFLITVPLRSIAKSYSGYLAYLLESGSKQKTELRIRTSLLTRLFRARPMYAGFCLSAAYLRRDKYILIELVSSGITPAIMVLVPFIQGTYTVSWIEYAYTIGLSPGFTTLFLVLGIPFVSGFLRSIKHSEHYKASYLFSLTPLAAPSDLWHGVQVTTLLYLVAPYTLLLFGIATVFWGVFGVFYVLPVLTLLLHSIVLYPEPPSGIPLSLEVVQKRRTSGLLSFICSVLASGLLVGIQFLAAWLNIWIYIGVYCVGVVGGFINFIYHFTKKRGKSA